MLDPWIIEEVKRRERKEQPRPQLPIPAPEPVPPARKPPEPKRVIIIDP